MSGQGIDFDVVMDHYRRAPGAERTVTFLPEPDRRARRFTVISVDDHLVEPPETFAGRLPAKLQDRAPKVVDTDDGGQVWRYDDAILPNVGFNAMVGRPFEEFDAEPTRFEHMRRGSWDVDARVADMDLNGVYASLNFPSFLAGFGGGRLQTVIDDRELALATLRAWNDWHMEAWVGAHPERFIPCCITWLHDPEVGAAEVERNAARGCHSLSFPELPHQLGFPTIHSDYYDPIFRACQETGTVVSLHVGSGGSQPGASPGAPPDVSGNLFALSSAATCSDWVHAKIAVRFPELKVCLSEGGIGWVPVLMDRMEHSERLTKLMGTWVGEELRPVEVLQRNFWFCLLDEPSAMPLLDRIGTDRILFEVDYPHADSSWPDTQPLLERQMAGLSAETVERISWRNAAALYQHPVPDAVQRDPESF